MAGPPRAEVAKGDGRGRSSAQRTPPASRGTCTISLSPARPRHIFRVAVLSVGGRRTGPAAHGRGLRLPGRRLSGRRGRDRRLHDRSGRSRRLPGGAIGVGRAGGAGDAGSPSGRRPRPSGVKGDHRNPKGAPPSGLLPGLTQSRIRRHDRRVGGAEPRFRRPRAGPLPDSSTTRNTDPAARARRPPVSTDVAATDVATPGESPVPRDRAAGATTEWTGRSDNADVPHIRIFQHNGLAA